MKHDVSKFIKICKPCNKVKPGKKWVSDGDFKVPDTRFSHVLVDIVGPLPPSYGYRYILTCIDRSTRFLQGIPLKEASASEAATAFLTGWLALFGMPSVVSSD